MKITTERSSNSLGKLIVFAAAIFLEEAWSLSRIEMMMLVALLISIGLSAGIPDERVVAAKDVRAAAKAGGPVNFDNCIIQGDLELRGLNMVGDVHFNRTIFRGLANFDSTNFEGNASFMMAEFKDVAIFSDAIFSYYADFQGADFGSYAGFRNTDFNGVAYHQVPNLNGMVDLNIMAPYADADFVGAVFSGDADFNNASFDGDSQFNNAVFRGNADFNSATFEGDVKFLGGKFDDFSDFENTIFNGNASFGDADFGETIFKNSSFNSSTNFFYAVFNGYASFRDVRFNHDADFWNATFDGNAYFPNAKFDGNAGFPNAVFNSNAYFWGTKFNSSDFTEAQFDKEAQFDDALFIGKTNFNDALFKEDALFEGADFKGELSLSRARYNKLYIRWYNISSFVYDDAAYMSLMKNFKDLGYYEDYDSCYFQYRRAHRDQPWPAVEGLEQFVRKKFIDYPLELFYGYGTKPFNAALFSLGIVLVFAAFWWRVGLGGPKDITRESLKDKSGESPKDIEEWLDGDITDILAFSATLFLSGTRLFIDPPPLPRIEGRSRSMIKKAFILERVLGALFSVLFFIAISGTIARAS